MTPSIIGQRIPKLDAPEKATGQATYGHDVRLPGMVHGRILYSQHPYARIMNVDTSQAEGLPGVICCLTGADNPGSKFGYGKDNTPFKGDFVRSMRDEVAAVVAVDPDTAEEALHRIKVEYQPLDPIFSAEEALQKDAPILHPAHGSNLFQRFDYAHGDLQLGESDSAVIVEGTYHLPYVAHACMETSVVIAHYDPTGRLTLWSTTQIPFLLQRDLAEALDIDGSRIRIIQTTIGGAFGRGLDIYPFEPIAALMARKSGKPVRLAFSREEEFFATPLRQPAIVQARAGTTKDGMLTFRDVNALLDVGAYVSWGAVTPLVMMETTASLYQVPHARFIAQCVYTNNPITGAVRGYGNPQSTFFIESLMDQLAEAIQMDPIDFRLRNVNEPNSVTPQGLVITSCGLKESLEAVAAAADRGVTVHDTPREHSSPAKNEPSLQGDRATTRKRGIGFAATLNVGGGARIYRSDGCGATVKVDDFGQITLITGSTEIGQGSETVLAQIVAETLGTSIDSLTVINSDTAVKPWDVGVHASRTTFIAGNAAYIAAQEARTKILETASELLETSVGQLDIENGIVFNKQDSSRSISLGKVVRRRHFREGGEIVIGEGWYDPPTKLVDKETYKGNISAAYSFSAQLAEVEVDVETGVINVLRLICASDVGRAINPMAVEGQIEGGMHMGLGYALTEEILVKDGQVLNTDFLDYKLFTAAEMPQTEAIIIETDDPTGPFGAKGVGEMGGTPTAAAIANAVYDAIGIRFSTLPMTPERVLRAIIQAKKDE
jgi:xanthine dehydrogenase molybdenum-binding subunit